MATQTFLDRVRVTSATTGQGTITLGAAVSPNFFTLAESLVADGAQITIAIEESGNIEISSGIVGGSGTTVTRATVHHSKIAGTPGTSKLELGGAAVVYVVSPAWWMIDVEARAGFHQKFPEIAPKTTNYTVTAADKGVPLIANAAGPIIFTLPPLAGALNEFYFFRDIGLGTLTLDGNASETIEGATTIPVPTGMAAMVWPNSSNGGWRAQVFGPMTSEIQGVIAKTVPADADLFGYLDSAASYVLKRFTWANTKSLLLWETITSAASAKTTPVDADLLSIGDSAASGVIKKLTWANLKATLASTVFPRWDAAQTLTAANQVQFRANVSSILKGQIFGLTLSNDAGDTVNDIAVAAGEAASTETNPVLMVLATGLIGQVDTGTWVAGTNQPKLDTGTVANATYHVFLIRNSTSGVVDILFSTSATAPTMPGTYDQKRRIGSFIRKAATNLGFSQFGDEFLFLVIQDGLLLNATLGTTASLVTLTVPTGIKVDAICHITCYKSAVQISFVITSPDQTDAAVSATNTTGFTSTSSVFGPAGSGPYRTNTSAQIRARSDTAASNLYGYTRGWIDGRGRNGEP